MSHRTSKSGGRRALTHVGRGRLRRSGDRELAERLATATSLPEGADGRELTHGFHSWPARMHPLTARRLLAHAPPGAVADHFMGGGTVAVEALLAGRTFYGGDVNPVAVEVAWSRTRRWDAAQCAALVTAAERAVAAAVAARDAGDLVIPKAFAKQERGWYDPPAFKDAWCLRHSLNGDDEVTRLLRTALSSVLVKASRQASDSVVVHDRAHRWVPKGRVLQWFIARVEEHARNVSALRARVATDTPEPVLQLTDARQPPQGAANVGLVVSSPPYPGVYDYAHHHARRYAMLDLDAGVARAKEIGARRELNARGPARAVRAYARDLGAVLAGWRPRLAPGGAVVWVIGDGQGPQGPIPVLPLVDDAAQIAGYRVVAAASQARPVFGPGPKGTRPGQRHKRPGRPKEEHLVWLEPSR